MSIVAGGLTVATAIGLPAGTWIGQHLGWRGTFWAIAVLATAAGIAVLAKVPDLTPDTKTSVRDEVRGLATPRLWLSYALTAVSIAALLCTFAYLAAILTATTGLKPAWVPAVLLAYGIGALSGMSVGGRAADSRPLGVLAVGFTALAIISALLALTTTHLVPVVVLVVLLGVAGFGTNPALNSRVVGIARRAPTLAVAGNVSAFNVGICVAPWLGGLALTAGLGYRAVPWIGSGLAIVALALLGLETRLTRARRSALPIQEQRLSAIDRAGPQPAARSTSPPGCGFTVGSTTPRPPPVG